MSNTILTLMDFHKMHHQLAANDVILDVRRPDEYQEAHMPNALNIPVDELAVRAGELKKFNKIYIHCKRGGRAKTAFETLKQQGLDNLVCIQEGGMDMWLEQGFPIEK